MRTNRRTVAGVRTVTLEAECFAPTLRALVPTRAFGSLRPSILVCNFGPNTICIMAQEDTRNDDSDGAYRRARRALRHLWAIDRGVKDYNPDDCDGCKEIHKFLTDPTYRGDTDYPMYDRIDPAWKLGPDDMEKVSEKERANW
jgi:hypothetical protein